MTRTWYLPVETSSEAPLEQALAATSRLVDAWAPLWEPTSTTSFVVATHGDHLTMGFQCSAPDSRLAREHLANLKLAAEVVAPWLTLAAITHRRPWPKLGPLASAFATHPSTSSAVSRRSPMVTACLKTKGPWHFVVTMHSLQGTASTEASQDDGTADTASTALCSVSLHGRGTEVRAITALAEADSVQAGRLAVVAAPDPLAPPISAIPKSLLALLLAAPSRTSADLRAADRSGEVLEDLHTLGTPHVSIIGATGQGKSTAQIAIGADALGRGDSLLVVDITDGAVTDSLAAVLEGSGRPYLYATWDGSSPLPSYPIMTPPRGVTEDQHVHDVVEQLEDGLLSGLNPDWKGPVFSKPLRALVGMAVKDPRGEIFLDDYSRLIDPSNQSFTRRALRRIGDPDVERTFVREVMPMITARDAGNAALFLTSKLEPFSSPTARNILHGQELRLPLQQALSRGYSVLLHVPVHVLGGDIAAVLISAILHGTWMHAQREPLPHRVTMLLDEFWLYATRLTQLILTQGRKSRLRLVLSHQNLAQLDPVLRETLLSNVGALMSYRIGLSDATQLAPAFPGLGDGDLATLRQHTLAVTTFDSARIVSGPRPLVERTAARPWADQLWAFHGGPEPAVVRRPRPIDQESHDELLGEDVGTDSTEETSFLETWLAERRAEQVLGDPD